MSDLAQTSGGGAGLANLLFFVVLLVGLYLLLIRPARARARALAEVRAALAPGARVMTTAGMHASVLAVDGDTKTDCSVRVALPTTPDDNPWSRRGDQWRP